MTKYPQIEAAIIKAADGTEIIVDAEDLPILTRYFWSVGKKRHGQTRYATTSVRLSGRRITFGMHRLLTGMSELHVDHINGNGLDNRKSNLRLCTRSQNMANFKVNPGAVPYRGVTYNNYNSPHRKVSYAARIRVNNERIYIGTYDDPIDAAKAYDEAAKKHFGPFAQLNFPEVPPEPCIQPITKPDTAESLLREFVRAEEIAVNRDELVDRAKRLLEGEPVISEYEARKNFDPGSLKGK